MAAAAAPRWALFISRLHLSAHAAICIWVCLYGGAGCSLRARRRSRRVPQAERVWDDVARGTRQHSVAFLS
jgi:hypothetical protein